MKKGTPVVVTTDSTKRGVFGGLFVSEKSDVVVLSEARMAVYWDKETRGVVGLASTGPTAGCRISPPAKTIKLNGVTSVMEMTPEALAAWRKQPWG